MVHNFGVQPLHNPFTQHSPAATALPLGLDAYDITHGAFTPHDIVLVDNHICDTFTFIYLTLYTRFAPGSTDTQFTYILLRHTTFDIAFIYSLTAGRVRLGWTATLCARSFWQPAFTSPHNLPWVFGTSHSPSLYTHPTALYLPGLQQLTPALQPLTFPQLPLPPYLAFISPDPGNPCQPGHALHCPWRTVPLPLPMDSCAPPQRYFTCSWFCYSSACLGQTGHRTVPAPCSHSQPHSPLPSQPCPLPRCNWTWFTPCMPQWDSSSQPTFPAPCLVRWFLPGWCSAHPSPTQPQPQPCVVPSPALVVVWPSNTLAPH